VKNGFVLFYKGKIVDEYKEEEILNEIEKLIELEEEE